MISLSNKSTKDPRRKAKHNKDAKWKLNKCTGGHNYELPPTAVDPCAEMKAPTPTSGGKGMCPTPPLPPEGGSGCKGGGEGAQEDLKFIQAKIRKRGEVCKEEGGQIQADPKPQSYNNQQKRFNSEKSNTQGRPTVKNMVLNILIACGAMLGVMPGPASGYSLKYFDCRSPTRIDKFARPTACDPFAADEEVAARTTFEVLAETREVSGWSCEVIHSEWRYRCGLFSHLKLSGVPHLLRHSPVTGADCRGMVRR